MKAVIKATLGAVSTSEAQRAITEVCERLVRDGVMRDYEFHIDTPEGRVGQQCLLAGDSVIA